MLFVRGAGCGMLCFVCLWVCGLRWSGYSLSSTCHVIIASFVQGPSKVFACEHVVRVSDKVTARNSGSAASARFTAGSGHSSWQPIPTLSSSQTSSFPCLLSRLNRCPRLRRRRRRRWEGVRFGIIFPQGSAQAFGDGEAPFMSHLQGRTVHSMLVRWSGYLSVA